MKKTLLRFVLMILILCSACTAESIDDTENTKNDPIGGNTTSSQEDSIQEEPPNQLPLNFQSYADLEEFSVQKSQQTELTQYGAGIASKGFPIPCLNGQPVALESSVDELCITLFSSELYRKPWIWYDSTIDNEPISVRIMLDQDVLATFDESDSCADILKYIAPNAPNIDNYNSENYASIFEWNITTADGAKTALVKKESDRDREYISFMQNGFFVTLSGPQDVITSEWLSSFCIAQSGLTGNDHVTE